MTFYLQDPSMGAQIQRYLTTQAASKNAAPAAQSILPIQNYTAGYTPNQHTARQLAELQSGSMGGGGNTIPMWMQGAYANKMARMGAPANGPLPYQLTGSSFRGMPAGKTAQTGGQ